MRILILLAAAFLSHAATLRYWIDPCPRNSHLDCRPGDADLAQWALEAWQSASNGALHLERARDKDHAQIRVFWADAQSGLYGEANPIVVDGIRGAEVYVVPAAARSNDPDPLLRETIVYLTCLHETGHALGLPHTHGFADIMYNFRYGGDIEEYFQRYRRQLSTRTDIRKHAGISPADRKQLTELWH